MQSTPNRFKLFAQASLHHSGEESTDQLPSRLTLANLVARKCRFVCRFGRTTCRAGLPSRRTCRRLCELRTVSRCKGKEGRDGRLTVPECLAELVRSVEDLESFFIRAYFAIEGRKSPGAPSTNIREIIRGLKTYMSPKPMAVT